MNLNIEVTAGEHTSTVTLAGEIDAYTAPQLKEKLLPLTQTEGHEAEVDLADVNYMDSTGLGIFISALKSTKENNSTIRLINLQDRVLRVFKITGLDEIMTIDDTGVRGGNV